MNNLRLQPSPGTNFYQIALPGQIPVWTRSAGDNTNILQFTFRASAQLAPGSDAIILLSNGNGTWYERCLLEDNEAILSLNAYRNGEYKRTRSIAPNVYGVDIRIGTKSDYKLNIRFILVTAGNSAIAEFFEIDVDSFILRRKPGGGDGDPKGTTKSGGPM